MDRRHSLTRRGFMDLILERVRRGLRTRKVRMMEMLRLGARESREATTTGGEKSAGQPRGSEPGLTVNMGGRMGARSEGHVPTAAPEATVGLPGDTERRQ